jgi:dinuclear metal center YbgI/SA1388 family protein
MTIVELQKYFLKLLNPENKLFHDMRANDLQINTHQDVKKIAFGVDASLEFMKEAVKNNADTIVVHHGISFTDCENSIPSVQLNKRLHYAYQNNLNVFGFHFLLDSHAELGNNAQIIKHLGFKIEKPAGEHNGDYWGWTATNPNGENLDNIYAKLNTLFDNNAKIHAFGSSEIDRILVISGGSSEALREAIENISDLFVCGEIKENTQEEARELGLNIVWGGHYITERFGPKALLEQTAKDTKLECVFIDVPNLS